MDEIESDGVDTPASDRVALTKTRHISPKRHGAPLNIIGS